MGFLAAAFLFVSSAAAQTEQDVKHPITGVFKGDIKDPVKKDVIMKVAMQAPSKLPEHKTLGLIVLHHGFNGNENNYFGGTVECAKRLGLSDQYVIIAGKSRGAGWAPADDEYVLRLIQWAKDTYPIDPRRVYEWGSSNGAAFVGRFGWHHQDLFAAVCGYCGSYNFSDAPACYKVKPAIPGPAAETKTEWYFVHGGNDNPQNSGNAAKDLKAKGYRVIFRQLDGYGHTDIWDGQGHPDLKLVDAVRDDWFSWMHSLRSKEIAPAKDEKAGLSSMLGKIKTEKGDSAKTMVIEAARIGGAPAAHVINNAIDSGEAEVRVQAVATTEKTSYSKEILIELVKLLKDKSDDVKLAAFKGLGSASNFRYPEAQDTLIRVSRTKSLPVADRVAAVEGLGKTVKLMLPGNFEDKLVVWTLVLLLDDDEAKVRETAFASMEKGVKDVYDYKPDMPAAERKASVAKWKQWCAKVAGPMDGPAKP
jgi:pimeloyl-ACP methyl ester carboxylesterase